MQIVCRFLLIEPVWAAINVTVPECLWNNTISFSCYWIYLAVHTYVHINVYALERRRLRSAIRKAEGVAARRGGLGPMIRDYANSVTCTLQRDRCTFKVNVGSADLSYGGCTIWHNSGRTYTLNIRRYAMFLMGASRVSRKCRRSRKSY